MVEGGDPVVQHKYSIKVGPWFDVTGPSHRPVKCEVT